MKPVERELRKFTNGELVAWWNILQAPVMRDTNAADQKELHEPIVDRLLTERNIPHKKGKRTKNDT